MNSIRRRMPGMSALIPGLLFERDNQQRSLSQ